jgi:hypothetical protein
VEVEARPVMRRDESSLLAQPGIQNCFFRREAAQKNGRFRARLVYNKEEAFGL